MKNDPQRGDIVIFRTDEIPDEMLIKRVIGLPGDSLMFIDGSLYINGELLYEDYLAEGMLPFSKVKNGLYAFLKR